VKLPRSKAHGPVDGTHRQPAQTCRPSLSGAWPRLQGRGGGAYGWFRVRRPSRSTPVFRDERSEVSHGSSKVWPLIVEGKGNGRFRVRCRPGWKGLFSSRAKTTRGQVLLSGGVPCAGMKAAEHLGRLRNLASAPLGKATA